LPASWRTIENPADQLKELIQAGPSTEATGIRRSALER